MWNYRKSKAKPREETDSVGQRKIVFKMLCIVQEMHWAVMRLHRTSMRKWLKNSIVSLHSICILASVHQIPFLFKKKVKTDWQENTWDLWYSLFVLLIITKPDFWCKNSFLFVLCLQSMNCTASYNCLYFFCGTMELWFVAFLFLGLICLCLFMSLARVTLLLHNIESYW